MQTVEGVVNSNTNGASPTVIRLNSESSEQLPVGEPPVITGVVMGEETTEGAGKNAPPSDSAELEKLADLTSESAWIAGLELGMQLMPDYDENGISSGFNKQNLFGRFTIYD